jgi:ComF family protein
MTIKVRLKLMPTAAKKHLYQFGNLAVDFLLPPLCPATGELVDRLGMVDAAFWQNLNFIHAPFCKICGAPFSFDNADDMACGDCLETPPKYTLNRSALKYDDGSRGIILRFKHGDQLHAVKAFTPWLQQAGSGILSQADIIMPVPLHRNRLIKRRYNQAELIAREISRHYPDAQYCPDGLLRIKNTVSQGYKRAKDRKKNVSQAFITNARYNFKDKKIVLIDDVYTTGATLNECAKTLIKAGAAEVNCLTLAKVVRD